MRRESQFHVYLFHIVCARRRKMTMVKEEASNVEKFWPFSWSNGSGSDYDGTYNQPFITWTTAAIGLGVAVVLHLSFRQRQRQRQRQNEDDTEDDSSSIPIPVPVGQIPLLGHALLYKNDPPGFLDVACQEVERGSGGGVVNRKKKKKKNDDDTAPQQQQPQQPIFEINLAGKQMIIIGKNCLALEQITTLPESICSAKYATSDIGFEQTLGYLNVHFGPDLHKRIMKSITYYQQHHDDDDDHHHHDSSSNSSSNNSHTSVVYNLFHSIKETFQNEVRNHHHYHCNNNDTTTSSSIGVSSSPRKVIIPDLFHFIRQIILTVSIEQMIGEKLLLEEEEHSSSLVQEFMIFQDMLEDATAKAVILPKLIALLLYLWPVQKKRLVLQGRIEKLLTTYYLLQQPPNTTTTTTTVDKDDNNNTANSTTTTTTNTADVPGFWLQEVMKEPTNYSAEEISEFIVGLLFAAHKNPAIGASQAYLFLWEHGTQQDQELCLQEAQTMKRFMSTSSSQQQQSQSQPPPLPSSSSSPKQLSMTQLRESCPRLYQVCLETLRLTGHTIGGVRKVCKDISLDGCPYKVRKGQTIGLSHSAANRDETIWEHPHDFNTLRDPTLYENNYLFTSFSQGIHQCPGQSYALAMMVCTLIQLLTAYEDVQFVGWNKTNSNNKKNKGGGETINKSSLPPVSFERATLAQREGPIPIILTLPKK